MEGGIAAAHLDDVVNLGIGGEVRERNPGEARAERLGFVQKLLLDLASGRRGNPKERMAIGPGACAAASGLDSEHVVEDGAYEVVVQEAGCCARCAHPSRRANDKGKDGEPA